MMKNLLNFIKLSLHEFFYKVSWSSWSYLQKTTGVVIIGMVIFSLIIYFLDLMLGNALNFIYDTLS